MTPPNTYVIGSLRNPNVPAVANALREMGFNVFDDWFAAGEKADEEWQAYETKRGHSLAQALNGFAANHVFEYDRDHLRQADAVVLIYPAGKSGFLELGWALGKGKPGFVYLPAEPERWDVMLRFANRVVYTIEDLALSLKMAFPDYFLVRRQEVEQKVA